MQTQKNNDTPAEELHAIFVVIFVAEFEQAEEKMEISMQNVERYKQRNNLDDMLRPVFNHLSLPRDLWIFPMHFPTVGFKDSLSIHVNPKYLNSLTNSIFFSIH